MIANLISWGYVTLKLTNVVHSLYSDVFSEYFSAMVLCALWAIFIDTHSTITICENVHAPKNWHTPKRCFHCASFVKYQIWLVCLSTFKVNIALNKPAYQLYQYHPGDDRFDASNAVDGLKSDFRGLNSQCTLSANDQRTAQWWVDFGTIHSIHHITIYYRTDNVTWGGYLKLFLWLIIQ